MGSSDVISRRPLSSAVERHTSGARVSLIGSFMVTWDGAPLELPPSAQRLVAFVALRLDPVQRLYVAGTLWADLPEDRAQASLRSSLWRVHHDGCRLVDSNRQKLWLAPAVDVDLRTATAEARRIIHGEASEPSGCDWTIFGGELLPDWYDDWLLMERERFRQLGLHALEAVSARLTAQGRFGPAVEAALAAVATDPLRESAQRALIGVHLAEGNTREAIRQYRKYAGLLHDVLGLEPSLRIRQMVPS
jgi:DNA-binding SARP family transcriptional activator